MARTSTEGAPSYSFRSGDASDESRSRLGEPGQIAPGPDYYPGPCRGGQGHDDEDLEDMGAALLWPAVVATFLIALLISAALLSGCAPRPASSAAAPDWCQDCAVGGAR